MIRNVALLVFGLILLMPTLSLAQSYKSINQDVQGWCVRGEIGGTLWGAYRYQSQEMLGGALYTKYATSVSMFDDTVFLREDLNTGEVWKYQDGQEFLLYDFSLAIGDTAEITFPGIGTVKYVVINTSTVMYPELGSLRQLELSTTDILPGLPPFAYQNPFWTEGVGSSWGPNYTSLVDSVALYFGDCLNLWTGEQVVVGDGGADCSSIPCTQAITTGLEVSAPADFAIYQQGGQLYLMTEAGRIQEISVVDLNGRVKQSVVTEFFSGGAAVNVAGFTRGLYLIQVKLSDGRYGSKPVFLSFS